MTTQTKKWFCKIKKGVRFTTGVFVLLGMVVGAWLQLGFPVPATAEDVKRLSKGQATIGLKVQLEVEKDLRREISAQEWELKKLEAAPSLHPHSIEYKKHLTKEIKDLKAQLDLETAYRNAYKAQLQKLEAD